MKNIYWKLFLSISLISLMLACGDQIEMVDSGQGSNIQRAYMGAEIDDATENQSMDFPAVQATSTRQNKESQSSAFDEDSQIMCSRYSKLTGVPTLSFYTAFSTIDGRQGEVSIQISDVVTLPNAGTYEISPAEEADSVMARIGQDYYSNRAEGFQGHCTVEIDSLKLHNSGTSTPLAHYQKFDLDATISCQDLKRMDIESDGAADEIKFSRQLTCEGITVDETPKFSPPDITYIDRVNAQEWKLAGYDTLENSQGNCNASHGWRVPDVSEVITTKVRLRESHLMRVIADGPAKSHFFWTTSSFGMRGIEVISSELNDDDTVALDAMFISKKNPLLDRYIAASVCIRDI